jgi:hypothetical protein
MTADLLTKPLHGEPFAYHRARLLGMKSSKDLEHSFLVIE